MHRMRWLRAGFVLALSVLLDGFAPSSPLAQPAQIPIEDEGGGGGETSGCDRYGAPNMPRFLKADRNTCSAMIRVEWTYELMDGTHDRAESYEVYRDDVLISDQGWAFLWWNDTGPAGGFVRGRKYKYHVIGVNCRGRSTPTPKVDGWIASMIRAPSFVNNVHEAGKVRLNWEAVPDADAYKLLRDGQHVQTIPPTPPPTPGTPPPTTALYTEVECGTHTYCIVAVNCTGEAGPRCAPPLASPFVLVSPGNVRASDCDGSVPNGVSVTWTDISGETQYRVYREGVLIKTLPANSTSYLDPNDAVGAPPGGTYLYCVKSFRESCGESTGNCDSGCMPVAVPPPVPTNVVASDCVGQGVTVTWGDVSGETEYRVYRNGTRIATVGAGVTSYLDPSYLPTSPPPGVYNYCVRSFRAAGGESAEACDSGCMPVPPPAWSYASYHPLGSMDAGMAYDSKHQRMITFGGYDDFGLTNDVWVLDMTTNPSEWGRLLTSTCMGGQRPNPRSRPAVAYIPSHDMLVSFGGNGASNGALWSLWLGEPDGVPRWCPITGSGTAPIIADVQGVHEPIDNRLIVVSPYQGVFALSLSNYQWTTLWSGSLLMQGIAAPGFSCAYDVAGERLIVFGGCYSGVPCPSTAYSMRIRTANPQWTAIAGSGPPPLTNAAMTYDAEGQRVLLHGGANGTTLRGELWQLSLTGTPAWSQPVVAGSPPAPRDRHAVGYDVRTDRFVVLGGRSDAYPPNNDTWFMTLRDLVPPSAVADLGFEGIISPNQIAILWSAPGDDGNVGTAFRYDLRIAEFPITQHTFGMAAAASPQPLTEVAGTVHEQWFSGLRSGTWYYFGIKTWDEAGNESPLAVTQMRTLGPLGKAQPTDLPVLLAFEPTGSNPVRERAAFGLAVPADRAGQAYRVEMFDVAGRRVRQLGEGAAEAGRHTFAWDLRDERGGKVANGVYFARLVFGKESMVRRIAVVR